jgi:hypothetical protein
MGVGALVWSASAYAVDNAEQVDGTLAGVRLHGGW